MLPISLMTKLKHGDYAKFIYLQSTIIQFTLVVQGPIEISSLLNVVLMVM